MNGNSSGFGDDFHGEQNSVEACIANPMTAAELNMQYLSGPKAQDECRSKGIGEAAVDLITSRAWDLFEQYGPDEITELARQIDELDPQQLVTNRLPETPFPVDALLGMDDAVKAVAERMKFPVAMVAQCALGLANAIIQGFVDVQLPSIGTAPTSLYLLTGNESGEGKSAGEKILSEILKPMMKSAQMEYEERLKKYHDEMAVYRSEVKAIENGKKKGEEGADMTRKAFLIGSLIKPVMPMNPRLMTKDFTIEGLRSQFSLGCCRLSIMTDEGATWMEGHALVNDRRGSSIATLCDRYDGKDWDVDRVDQEKCVSLTGRRLSLSVSTQFMVLEKLLTDPQADGQGLLARCLISMPDSRVGERRMQDINWSDVPAVVHFQRKLAKLYNTDLVTKEKQPSCLEPRVLEFDAEATGIYMDYGNDRFKQINGKYASVRALALKADQHIARLAATLAVWDDPETAIISGRHMSAACRLMDYYLNERVRFVNDGSHGSGGSTAKKAIRLLDWVKQNNRYLVYSTMLAHCLNRDVDTINKAMDFLVRHDHAIPLKKGVNIDQGKRKKAWLITV